MLRDLLACARKGHSQGHDVPRAARLGFLTLQGHLTCLLDLASCILTTLALPLVQYHTIADMADNPFDWQTRQNRRAQAAATRGGSDTGRSRDQDHQEPRARHEQRPSSMKREGSRSRVPHLRPEFDEVGSNAPDLERKNRPADRKFRDKRDGYESDEGEAHRRSTRDRRRRDYDDDSSEHKPPRRRDEKLEPSRRREHGYDNEPPRRSRNDHDYRHAPESSRQYDSDRRRDRRRDYSSDSESDRDRHPHRRHSAGDDRRYRSDGRREKARDDHYRDSDDRDARRRREEIYDRDRETRRSDGRHGRDRDVPEPARAPRHIKVGKYDIGPYVEQGEKHYKTFAPMLKPIVMDMAKQYMAGRMGGKH